MNVVMHLGGTATSDAIPKIRRAFEGSGAQLSREPAFERAELLVNHAELKVQFLLYWSDFDAATAYMKASGPALMLPFQGMVEDTFGPFYLAVEGEVGA